MNELTKMKDDPRRGMPSGSDFGNLAECPRKHSAEKGKPNPESKEATAGTRIHEFCFDPVKNRLEDENELAMAKQMLSERNAILTRIFPGWEDDPPESFDEVRMWYRKERYSGVPDLLRIRARIGFIGDYKSGPHRVTNAADNWQLAALVVLADYNHDIDGCHVAIIQPLCGAPSTHYFDKAAIKRLRNRVTALLRRVESPDSPFNPGESQCRYCRAKVDCPALAAAESKLMTSAAPIDQLSPEVFSGALSLLPMVEARCKAIREEAHRRLTENPHSVPGFELREQSERRSIACGLKAHNDLTEAGLIDTERLLKIVSIPVGKLEKAVADFTDTQNYDARHAVAEVLDTNLKYVSPRPKVVEQ